MKRLFLLFALLLVPSLGRAAEGEMQLSAAGSLSFLPHDGRLNYGIGGGLSGTYGITHYIAVQAELLGDHFMGLAQMAEDSSSRYDATRIGFFPSAAFHFGSQFVTELALGVGYRLEIQTSRLSFFARTSTHHDNAVFHSLVGKAAVSWEWQFSDYVSIMLKGAIFRPLVGSASPWDAQAGLTFSMYFFPT